MMKILRKVLPPVVFSVCFAGVSTILTAVTARIFESDKAADIYVIWTAVNIGILVIQSPIEIQASRIRHLSARHDSKEIVFFYLFATAVLLSIFFASLILISNLSNFMFAFSVVIFIFCHSLFYWRRALLLADGNYLSLMNQALVVLSASTILWALLMMLDVRISATVFLIPAISYLSPFLFRREATSLDLRQLIAQLPNASRFFKERTVIINFLSLFFSNAVSLTITSGGVVLSSVLGLDPNSILVYSAMISISMAPLLLLNSLIFPVVQRGIIQIQQDSKRLVWRDYLIAMSLFLTITLSVAVMFGVIGRFLIGIYLGQKFAYLTRDFFFVALSTGLAVLTGLPRLLLTGFGRAREFNKFLLVSLAMYFVSLSSVRDKMAALIIASASASTFILVTGTIMVWTAAHSKTEYQI